MRKWRHAYPVLLATVPPLIVAANNPGEYAPRDLGAILVAIVVAFAIPLVVLALLLRRRAPHAAPTLLLAAVLWLWAFVPAQRWFRNTVSWRLGADAILIPIALLFTVVALRWLLRRPARSEALTRTLSVMAILLVAWSGGRVLRDLIGSPGTLARSPLAREVSRPIRIDSTRRLPGQARPDVYLIIMDTYPSSEVLREFFGYDNRPFEDSLRALGFVLPRVRSNYVQTKLSLPSLLNMRHMTPLAAELDSSSSSSSLPYYLIEHNAVARFFKRVGYRYVFFPSSWWPGTADSEIADEVFQGERVVPLRYLASRSELRRVLWRSSLFKLLGAAHRSDDPAHALLSFDGLATSSSHGKPTFTLAHFLMPHVPYLYDEECRVVPDPPPFLIAYGSPLDKSSFIPHLRCANKQLLRVVRALKAGSRVPPIIVIVGDHGTQTTNPSLDASEPSAQQVRERMSVFGAFYLPGGGIAEMRDSVTLVNVMRFVLAHYFGAVLPPQPDEHYYSTERRPYAFRRVRMAETGGLRPE